jgi:hypothetical protein
MKVTNYARLALAIVLPLAAGTGYADYSQPGLSLPIPSNSTKGIVAPSFPNFVGINDTVKVVQKFNSGGTNSYWSLTGSGTTSILDSLNGKTFTSYNLGGGDPMNNNYKTSYVANFDANGKLITTFEGQGLSNTLTIYGSLQAGRFGNTSWAAQPNELLLSANLTGGTIPNQVGTYGSFAIGFNTQFTGGWAADNLGLTGGSTGESLWLAGISADFAKLVKALDGNISNGTMSTLFSSNKTIKGVFSVASVPVPGAVWLFGTGLMTFFAGRRKSAAAKLAA